MVNPPLRAVALTIAGTDSSGGAGVAADLKTFAAHGLWGACAITAVTAQNTLGLQTYSVMTPELVRAQVASVVTDLNVVAAKTGMLGSAEVVKSVAKAIAEFGVGPLVVDPVLASGQGQALASGGATGRAEIVAAIKKLLLPITAVFTPNLAEAEAFTGLVVADREAMLAAARVLLDLGPAAVMITGGHLVDTHPAGSANSPDLVAIDGFEPVWLESPRLDIPHTHGTGCVLSSALCAGLGLGLSALEACRRAKEFVTRAIAAGVDLGAGDGSVDPGSSVPTGLL